jgi:hypothetical protein
MKEYAFKIIHGEELVDFILQVDSEGVVMDNNLPIIVPRDGMPASIANNPTIPGYIPGTKVLKQNGGGLRVEMLDPMDLKSPKPLPPVEVKDGKKYLSEAEVGLKGIKVEVADDGSRVLREVSPETMKLMRFVDLNFPCWFNGCEDLRNDYKKDLEKHGGAECKSCVRGALNKKYLKLAQKMIDNEKSKIK